MTGIARDVTTGRNRYCIYRTSGEGLPDTLNDEIDLEKGLRQAIPKGELLLYYQPRVNLKDGLITGIHALLRWDRGSSGILLPDTFLPLANKT